MQTFQQFLNEQNINHDIYMKGRCAVFALALYLEKGYELGVLWDINEDSDRDYMPLGEIDYDAYDAYEEHGESYYPEDFSSIIHVFCYKMPGILVDVNGQTTKSKMLDWANHVVSNGPIDPSFTNSDRDEVEEFMEPQSPDNPHGGMLAPKPGEIEKLRQYIRANPDRY